MSLGDELARTEHNTGLELEEKPWSEFGINAPKKPMDI